MHSESNLGTNKIGEQVLELYGIFSTIEIIKDITMKNIIVLLTDNHKNNMESLEIYVVNQ